MNELDRVNDAAKRLQYLVTTGELNDDETATAMLCHRRLLQPLRLAIFGTNPKHALQLLNLLAGQSLVPPFLGQVHTHVVYSEEPYAEVQFGNGNNQRIKGSDFSEIFANNPERAKLGVRVPLLQRVAFLVTANPDSAELCIGAARALSPCDIVIWAGEEMDERMADTWYNMPRSIQDHSYLVLPQNSDSRSWASVRDEFVSVHMVDARAAQAAKSKKGGVDKTAFRKSGGAGIVKDIKKEVEHLRVSAFDGAEFILTRHNVPEAADLPDFEPKKMVLETKTKSRPRRISVPLEVKFEDSANTPDRPDAEVVKIMPKRVSKDDDEARPTPWSLGL
ncbi:MAG: hypothetical protein AAFY06_00920 [Pseudomonadota bacterium]